jgi:hypothetical protein
MAARDRIDQGNSGGSQRGRHSVYNLLRLLNLFEIACAIMNEESVAGFSREIIHKYLVNALGLIVGNDYARDQIPKMLTDETTFEHINTFIKSLRNRPLRFIIPVEWYEL